MKYGQFFKWALLLTVIFMGIPDAHAQYRLDTSELAPEKTNLLEQAYTNARVAHLEATKKLEECIDDRRERSEALLKLREVVASQDYYAWSDIRQDRGIREQVFLNA